MTKSNVYLLGANVLIRLATCPITQGALVRFHFRAGVDATAKPAKLLLESISSLALHEFWPDDVSYLEIPTKGIIGHRQVTDAYLALLARKHAGLLATMDQALAALQAGTVLIGES